jgi:hypothetical protein
MRVQGPVNHNISATDAARDAVADLQHEPFEGAKRLVEEARIMLVGDAAQADAPPAQEAAPQATREPSSDTVQNPAGE